jgi:hypothetical protein
MTPRELERLEKDSIYTIRLTNDLKEQVINSHLNEITKVVKKEIKSKELIILVVKN